MSGVTAAASARVAAKTPAARALPMRWVRRIGCAVLGLELAGFLFWSTILYRRFALTSDFAMYQQAWYLIAHGNLNPNSTVQVFPFWQNHTELLMWPLALLYWVWPHGVTLLWVQDACVIGAEMVAFTWLCDVAKRCSREKDAVWLASAGMVLLAVNPWIWLTLSFDVHMETFATLFAVLLARDLANGRRRAWAWVLPMLAATVVAGTYLAGLGLGGVLAGRRTRLSGAGMVFVGVAATLLITLVHGNAGSSAHAYAYIAAGSMGPTLSLVKLAKGIVTHPLRVLQILWQKHVDIFANLAPGGLVGVGSLLLMPFILVVLLANTLFRGWLFTEPIFQNLPVYVLMPVGTIAVLEWLIRRRRRLVLALATLLVAQALGWAAVWAPRMPDEWLRVSAPAAATLAATDARIPPSAEVVVSQGVIGRFAGRSDVRSVFGPEVIPLTGGETWFIITPSQGIEAQSTASAMALIGELAGPLRATLVTHANGVWVFRWHPPADVHSVTVPGESAPLPAWAAPVAPGTVGRPVMTGTPATWRVTATGGRGYVADELAWQKPPGRYEALVTLSAISPVNVEVWNDTGNTLLSRQSVPATTGTESVVLPVDATVAYRARAYSGWGPFRADFVPPPSGERLEVRVWSPGGTNVNVYGAELVRSPR